MRDNLRHFEKVRPKLHTPHFLNICIKVDDVPDPTNGGEDFEFRQGTHNTHNSTTYTTKTVTTETKPINKKTED
jgi:hypothetical protein